MIRRVWHWLFDERYWCWNTTRAINFWCSWFPYLGGCVDANILLVPPHTADPNDPKDMSWGPEFQCGFTFLWLCVSLTLPNDEHPDNDYEEPKHFCESCDGDAHAAIALHCTACHRVEALCECIWGARKEEDMAIYEFRCQSSKCSNESFEVQLPMDERDTACVRCPQCNSEARRQVVPSKPPSCVITVPMEQGGHTKERLLP